ncbi:MAG: lipid A biosynthesis lauroyl acyltransferase [Sulfuricurvum sp.]
MGFRLFLLLEKLLMILPRKLRKGIFTSLATIAYYASKRYRSIGFTNLDFVFGDTLSYEQKRAIVKHSFRNLLLNFYHLMELRHSSPEQITSKVTIKNKEIIDRIHAQNRAIIYITPHYCAWELGGASIGLLIEHLAVVFRKMKNRDFEQWVIEAREHFGNSSLEKRGVVKHLIKLVKAKKAMGILIDTAINKNEGIEVDFMGKRIFQTPSPAYLARKYDAAIVPITMTSEDEEHYELTFFDEIITPKSDDEKQDILEATQKQANWLASLIQSEPKFWFWVHRRFKYEYPHIYKPKSKSS